MASLSEKPLSATNEALWPYAEAILFVQRDSNQSINQMLVDKPENSAVVIF